MVPFFARVALDHKLRLVVRLPTNTIQRIRHVVSLWHGVTSWPYRRGLFQAAWLCLCKYCRHIGFQCSICGKEISLFVISTKKSAGTRKMEKVRAQTSRALEWLDYRLGTEYLSESATEAWRQTALIDPIAVRYALFCSLYFLNDITVKFLYFSNNTIIVF